MGNKLTLEIINSKAIFHLKTLADKGLIIFSDLNIVGNQVVTNTKLEGRYFQPKQTLKLEFCSYNINETYGGDKYYILEFCTIIPFLQAKYNNIEKNTRGKRLTLILGSTKSDSDTYVIIQNVNKLFVPEYDFVNEKGFTIDSSSKTVTYEGNKLQLNSDGNNNVWLLSNGFSEYFQVISKNGEKKKELNKTEVENRINQLLKNPDSMNGKT